MHTQVGFGFGEVGRHTPYWVLSFVEAGVWRFGVEVWLEVGIQGVPGDTGCTRGFRVYQGIQGVPGDSGCTRGYRVYQGIQGVPGDSGCTRGFRVYQGI